MKPFLLLLLAAGIAFSCEHAEVPPVTDPEDYNSYLSVHGKAGTSKYFELWNSKITEDSTQLISFGHVASEYDRYFKLTGDIKYLKMAEHALARAVSIAAIGKANYNRALARNFIAQHRFREALELAEKARRVGSGVKETQYLLFDIQMELGGYEMAEKYLDSVKNFSDFGYLIRLAKWNDHLGQLDTTIKFMEKAAMKAEEANDTGLKIWSYTNLADFYGHAGRIEDSYTYYLKSLALDPANAYAKKGIAWIVFSHENNPGEAMRILDSVTESCLVPDYYLLKAEIAAFMGNEKKRLENLDQYFNLASNPAYGQMYNVHNVTFYLEETAQIDRALALAAREVENRPTPETYALLAYSYFKSGQQQKAEAILEEHVEGKTYEPAVLLQAAEIYSASDKQDLAMKLKSELEEALFELGPGVARRLEKI